MSKELSVFQDKGAFEDAQRMAKMLSSSDMVPKEYKETGNGKGIANTMIALNLARRTGSDPLMVMQNLYLVHGRPGWSSAFIIASLNSCGRFEPLQFVMSGEGNSLGCFIRTKDKNGNVLEGPEVNIAMAKAEGWLEKSGSKWKTMPALMIRYRAAAFFGRLYAPDILMGMQTAEELQDVVAPPSGMITLSEAKIKTFFDILRNEPTQANIDALTEELIKLNVNPEQTTQIILDGQAIIDAAQFNQEKPEVGTQPVSLFPDEGGAK